MLPYKVPVVYVLMPLRSPVAPVPNHFLFGNIKYNIYKNRLHNLEAVDPVNIEKISAFTKGDR